MPDEEPKPKVAKIAAAPASDPWEGDPDLKIVRVAESYWEGDKELGKEVKKSDKKSDK